MSELTTLDERLAEIDERLRSLQLEFDGGDEPTSPAPLRPVVTPIAASSPPIAATPSPVAAAPLPAAAAPSPAAAAPPEDVFARLRELAEAHERLLDLHRELLTQYAELLARRASEAATVSLVAGPFADSSALRAFQRDLGELPGVTGVTTREFPGGDRVALDVRLGGR